MGVRMEAIARPGFIRYAHELSAMADRLRLVICPLTKMLERNQNTKPDCRQGGAKRTAPLCYF